MSLRSNKLIIGIVNWNSYDLTANAIESIKKFNNNLDFNCFVVDNNSCNIEGKDRVLNLIGPDNLIENKVNVGFGRANNQIIDINQDKDILILNPDTIQIDDAITRAWEMFIENDNVGVIGIRHIDYKNGENQLSAFRFGSPWFQIMNILKIDKIFSSEHYVDHNIDQDVDWVTGSFMLVRSQVVRETKGFDEEIFLNNEDVEWCMRIKKKGWRVRYYSSLAFQHIGGGTRHFMKDSRFSFVRSHIQFLLKTNQIMPFIVYYLLNVLIAFKSLIILACKSIFISDCSDKVSYEFNRFTSILFLRAVQRGS